MIEQERIYGPLHIEWFMISLLIIIGFAGGNVTGGPNSKDIRATKNAFIAEGFSGLGWHDYSCSDSDLRNGLCVGEYIDDQVSIYASERGHAFIHGRARFTKSDIKSGEAEKWIGSTKYGEIYTIEKGYLFLPKSSFPRHIVFSSACRSIRVQLNEKTLIKVREVLDGKVAVGIIFIEYPPGYDIWHSREPLLIESPCWVESRSYLGKYQHYLGPLRTETYE
jgi:hypothetical protein